MLVRVQHRAYRKRCKRRATDRRSVYRHL